ncbi:polysaccharide pyruvyl transferase family protein [Pseudarthrobacter sp. fls2-241-R2A-168]|uniref:polysaccharide pyruvyl transferase family protein n=1 Tax=Pseudarthrobacter sp. fls2-241-R2A-168 TaxID=3040304 RepID=UPI002553353C|nr:polysaccharide pyruvyl transferase family protein [Pseudarthrobacter sp. fls2-241-R2A-168]
MKRVLIAHGYSAKNSGDGLLVHESIELIKEAFGSEVCLTILASYPESFSHLGVRVVGTKPTSRGYDKEYVSLLRSRFRDFDVVVGVGGGYLRAGNCLELLKTGLVMGPQLMQVARSKTPSVYLPQSIGPARLGSRGLMAALLRRIGTVWVRDDRSAKEFADADVSRSPDLAILGMKRTYLPFGQNDPVVLSVRSHRGSVPEAVYVLRAKMGVVDSFIQSTVGGNDDTRAVHSLLPRKVLDQASLMLRPASAKVVVAMRLHAALMALRAGHYVIHLSYERKGFGAFSDLGLSEYVFNVHDFDPEQVRRLAQDLLENEELRDHYDASVARASDEVRSSRRAIVSSLQQAVGLGKK